MIRNFPSNTGLVLVFIRLRCQSQREKMSGIYAAATRLGWQVLPLDEQFSAKRLRELVRLWRPLGCLIDTSSMSEHPTATKQLANALPLCIPIVLLGRDMTRARQIVDCSVQNPRSAVRTAVKKFRGLGLVHFAFFGDPLRPSWSTERERHFKLAVRSWDCQSYSEEISSGKSSPDGLVAWLQQLPKPVGVLLAADHLALTFYAAAARAGLVIGTDLVVIGVDNDEQLCNSLTPTLSSVRLDYFQSGQNGIELLEKRIATPSSPLLYRQYGSIELVSRSSSARHYPDNRVNNAIRFIEEHGCERISTSDVAATMGCGRRMAEKLFIKHVGTTILSAIRQKRLEKAKVLLQSSHYPIDAIPNLCGYESAPHLKTFFREQTGMTMRDWRKLNRSRN